MAFDRVRFASLARRHPTPLRVDAFDADLLLSNREWAETQSIYGEPGRPDALVGGGPRQFGPNPYAQWVWHAAENPKDRFEKVRVAILVAESLAEWTGGGHRPRPRGPVRQGVHRGPPRGIRPTAPGVTQARVGTGPGAPRAHARARDPAAPSGSRPGNAAPL